MNGNQIFVSLFGLLSTAVSAWALWRVLRSRLRYKTLWILGCLLGFVGFGLVWTKPEHLILLFGIQIPPIDIFTIVSNGDVIIKTGFPVVAVVALLKSRTTPMQAMPTAGTTVAAPATMQTVGKLLFVWAICLVAMAWLAFNAADLVARI